MTEYSFFDGRKAANFICNYREADPWWVFSPGFNRQSVKKIVNSNITVAPAGCNSWYQSASIKIAADGESGVFPRMHADSIKIMVFSGTEPKNPDDLGAKVYFKFEDETYCFSSPFVVVVPKGCRYGGIYTADLRTPYIVTEILPSQGFNGCDLNELEVLPFCPPDFETVRGNGKYSMYFLPCSDGKLISVTSDANPYGKGKMVTIQTELVSGVSTVRPPQKIAQENMYISVLSTSCATPRELGGEFEFILDDELRKINISCMIYIPKGSSYTGPYFTNVQRSILVSSVSV